MGYSPIIGRFLQRDPIGQIGPERSLLGEATENAIRRARKLTAVTLGAANKENRELWQYAEGKNVYEFLTGNPLNGVDPTGLDRYVTGPQPHEGIAVDTWKLVNGTYVWAGKTQYDFRAAWSWTIGGFFTTGCKGQVDVDPTGPFSSTVETIPSTPQEDIALKAKLDAEHLCPPVYHLIVHNCRDFANYYKGEGKAPATDAEIKAIIRNLPRTGY